MGKIKEVHPPQQVCHLWAHKAQPRARTGGRGNVFFEGDTIFSYGTHFPMARHVENKRGESAILYTTRGYSVSTSKHLSYVRQAIPMSVQVFHVADVQTPDLKAAWADYVSRVDAARKAVLSSRLYAMRHWNELQSIVEQANRFAKFMGLRVKPLVDGIDSGKAAELIRLADARRQVQEDKARAKRDAWDKIMAERYKDSLPKWRNHEANHLYGTAGSSGFAYLRLSKDGTTVETSMGARFPLEHGERAFRLLHALRGHGRTYQHNGHTIHCGDFRVDSMDEAGLIHAGCHRIEWNEVQMFAVAQGWLTSIAIAV